MLGLEWFLFDCHGSKRKETNHNILPKQIRHTVSNYNNHKLKKFQLRYYLANYIKCSSSYLNFRIQGFSKTRGQLRWAPMHTQSSESLYL